MPDLVEHPLIETFQLDVCDEASIEQARNDVSDLVDGKLDILVNSAYDFSVFELNCQLTDLLNLGVGMVRNRC